MSAPAPNELPPPALMLQMIQGFWISRAIYAAAKLGIPDLLKEGPRNTQDLARATGTHASSLYRLLRALDSIGVFAEQSGDRFTLTPLGATLLTDVPGSLRFFAIEELGENHYPAWEKVLYSLQTGAIAFDHVYGESKWQYMAKHPDEAKIFDNAMASFSWVVSAAVAAACDFSSSRTVVDLGGGDGSLLSGILHAHPHLQGVVGDVPHVIERTRQKLEAEGLSHRCGTASVDFFKAVPASDTYLLKWILHDWTDEQSVTILKNCRDAMTSDGRVLIVEAVLQPGAATSLGKFVDLNMLVMTGGRERTETEYRTLLEASGLKLTKVIPTQTEMSIVEAAKA